MKTVRTIGKYEVIRVLGVGGMGTVYQCIDPDLQRFVAVKVLNIKKNREIMEALRLRFLREALTTAQLQHPGIPPVYEVGKDENGSLFYVMKPIEGQSLQNIILKLKENDSEISQEFDLYKLIGILRGICQTVLYAHNKGHIHRDLKPSNIFVGNYGEVYVIDWGLTKVIKDTLNENAGKFSKLRELFEIDRELDCKNIDLTQTLVIDDVIRTQQFDMDKMTHTQMLEDLIETKEISLDKLLKSVRTQEFGQTEINVDQVLQKTVMMENMLPAGKAAEMAQTLTMHGKVLGTLSYMPPEQALGRNELLGKEVDIYALGVILYEMLTLELPISDTDFKKVVNNKIKGLIEAPELRTSEREIPPELSAIAMQSMNPIPDERFNSLKDFISALDFWLEGKSQFRQVNNSLLSHDAFLFFPESSMPSWKIDKDSITTLPSQSEQGNYMFFNKELIGNAHINLDFIAAAGDEEKASFSEIVFVLNYKIPKKWDGYHNGYSIHLAANQNTRAFISKNDAEITSNEYIIIEPRKLYQLVIEKTGGSIKVSLNNQVILFYQENYSLSGMFFGFLNRGPDISYSHIKIKVQGMPNKVSALDVPEALMAEGCYRSAMNSFLAIAQGHKNRYLGAWSCYRAGIAAYYMTREPEESASIWKTLNKGPYAIFEILGKASIEIERGFHLEAISTIQSMFSENVPVPHLESVADIVFSQAQRWLRKKQKNEAEWKIIDGWARLCLIFGQRLEKKQSMTPSILWRWLLLALTEYPQYLSDCLIFLRSTFGKGKGAFAEVLTTIEPLVRILKRSAAMSDHAFIVVKVMRLIMHHDDNLGNLETLVRFYINSGHIDVAERISEHIKGLCEKYDCPIPPAPIAFLSCIAWVGNRKGARALIDLMINKSSEWAVADGRLLLGLDYYKAGNYEEARKCWSEIVNDRNAVSFNRHLIAKGLLGELSPDPLEAGVPNRSDHRVMYCTFVGYRFFLDWKFTGSQVHQDTAVKLLRNAVGIMRPSYDIYSATDVFCRVPLRELGYPLDSKAMPEPLSTEESEWLQKLTDAAFQMQPQESHKTTAIRKYSSYKTDTKAMHSTLTGYFKG